LSSLEIKKFLWYNIYGEREATSEQMFGLPPQPPDLLLYHKRSCVVKCFCENFFRKFFKKVLHYFFIRGIMYM
jgi:hypothetical protein